MGILLMEEEKALEKLRDEVVACQKCPLGSQCTQKVFGEGPVGAKIMSISEAPGKEEDETGKPYMGRAGSYWEGMLKSVEWERSHIYTCNTLKCRPPNNRYNKDLSEADKCIPYLHKQISIHTPRLILIFGKLAGYALGLLPKDQYDKTYRHLLGIQPKPYEYRDLEGKLGMATVAWLYHPSYLMKGQKARAQDNAMMYGIMVKAKEIYDGMDR